MRAAFPGYYCPTTEDFEQLWNEGWFVLDANILLNLYRYQEKARDEFLAALRKLSPRVWVPYQAVLEYQRNRVKVVDEQLRRFRDFRKVANFEALEEALNQYNKQLRSLVDPSTFLTAIKPAFDKFSAEITEVELDRLR